MAFSVSLALSSLDNPAVAQTTVSDIDGNVYPVVRIGEQSWFATNLQVTRAPSGEGITSFFFDNDSLRYAGRGRLYTWGVAMNGALEPGAQGLCPDGWHLPTDEDWIQLYEQVKGLGADLMVGGSTGFDASLDGGADYRGRYMYSGEFALFWSSTVTSEERAYHHSISNNGELGKFAAMKGARIYVRCVGD
jgi:uncharacterized protein (TIGR02145 family)